MRERFVRRGYEVDADAVADAIVGRLLAGRHARAAAVRRRALVLEAPPAAGA